MDITIETAVVALVALVAAVAVLGIATGQTGDFTEFANDRQQDANCQLLQTQIENGQREEGSLPSDCEDSGTDDAG